MYSLLLTSLLDVKQDDLAVRRKARRCVCSLLLTSLLDKIKQEQDVVCVPCF
jgi:hypothetical protein